MPSPVVFTTRPRRTAIAGSAGSRRMAFKARRVSASSAPINRLWPTTSPATIAASRRSTCSSLNAPLKKDRAPAYYTSCSLTGQARHVSGCCRHRIAARVVPFPIWMWTRCVGTQGKDCSPERAICFRPLGPERPGAVLEALANARKLS